MATRRSPAATEEQLRLMVKVARLYHEHGIRQPEIARRLHVSQARVSRLLKQAELDGIVRTTVVVPAGVQTALEEGLEERYGLREAVVVELLDDSEASITRDLGNATARFLEASLTGGDVVGISSWSSTLLAAVDAMRPLPPKAGAERALQLFGGVGNPAAEAHAARLTQRFADLTGARPTFLLAPGIASSIDAREALTSDRFVQEALAGLADVTLALVGIGALEPSSLLQSSGNIFSAPELEALGAQGAVGDICLRFFDAGGARVDSDVDRRVIGVSLEQLREADRSVGIAGGPRKYAAIRGALRGGWINVLITDSTTAERLLAEPAT
ncbi:MAG TPA: sugar-binding transcriptional regulator [Solirubrobacteraceae bacterium]|nr:sugar-binding transcriptional regulator [Solirubrobacteraceae bacterium]